MKERKLDLTPGDILRYDKRTGSLNDNDLFMFICYFEDIDQTLLARTITQAKIIRCDRPFRHENVYSVNAQIVEELLAKVN